MDITPRNRALELLCYQLWAEDFKRSYAGFSLAVKIRHVPSGCLVINQVQRMRPALFLQLRSTFLRVTTADPEIYSFEKKYNAIFLYRMCSALILSGQGNRLWPSSGCVVKNISHTAFLTSRLKAFHRCSTIIKHIFKDFR